MPPFPSPRSRDDFRIAIICALSLEAGFVELALDICWEDEGQRYGKAVGDQNVYTSGVIGGHNVVLAYMPGMGNTSAAAVAVGLRMSFRSIELALLVGICGVVPFHPTTKEEIVLGDCIISTAVIQYDFGRQYPGGFERKNRVEDSLGRAGPQVRALTTKLNTRLGRRRLTKQLNNNLTAIQSQALEAKYPGVDRDQLYESSYIHEHIGTSSKACDEVGCDIKRLIIRERLNKSDRRGSSNAARDFPQVHFGRFGSANTVIKSGEDRDRLAEADEIIAFDMESAGIWEYCPTIVIKAASDYADSHKNKEWQGYAAATAAACMKSFLEEWVTANQSVVQDKVYSPVHHIPFNRKDGFVGRTDELQRIKQNLLRQDGDRLMAIVGLGGIGKSRLALELAYLIQAEQQRCSVFWVQATDRSTFEKDVRDIGIKLDIPGIHDERANVKELVKQQLNDPKHGRWLLILDNADDEAIWTKRLDLNHDSCLVPCLPHAQHGFVLLTTRTRRVATSLAENAVVELRSPSPNEAYLMFVNRLENPAIAADNNLTSYLLERLSYLPLAITQAASFLNMTQESVFTYLDLLNEPETKVIDLLSEDFQDASRYPNAHNPVAMTWLISFDHIRQHDSLAATYLSSMACLHDKGIPQSLLPEANSKLDAVKAIATLTGYSFITKKARMGSSRDLGEMYDMHPLVHLTTRNWLRMEASLERYMRESLFRLQRLFPSPDHKLKEIWTTYLPHVERLCLESALLSDPKRYLLMEEMGRWMVTDGKYDQAVVIHNEVVNWREVELGFENGRTLSAYDALGEALNYQGNWSSAEKYLLRAFHGREKKYGKEDCRTLLSQSNLASAFWGQGRWQEAEELEIQMLETSSRVFGPEHLGTLTIQGNLATTYRKQGRYQEAEELEIQVLEMSSRVLGPEHPDTLKGQTNLARIWWSHGHKQKAMDLMSRCITVQSRVLGEEHPSTKKSQRSLEKWQTC